LYSSQNIIQAIKSSRMQWVEHVACMEDKGIQNFSLKILMEETTRET